MLFIPFFFFFITTALLGGSAFNDAANDYVQYQSGHFYLCSHGAYTEVSHGVFLFAKIIEIIGIGTFAVGFILTLIRNITRPYEYIK